MGNTMNHEETVVMPGESNPSVFVYGGICPFGKVYNPSAMYMAPKEQVQNGNAHLRQEGDKHEESHNLTTHQEAGRARNRAH
uniref:Predicted protein n=1 Tax=Hordeum vulgare subsp. vulgare TaxID=112509 RepID=F2DKZ9_HORVV|nr:predicted protein [Hordeum vulgare subsp. vulgare]